MPIVLQIDAREELAEVTRAECAGDSGLQDAGLVGDEVGNVGKVEQAVGIAEGDDVVLEALEGDAELEGMATAGEEGIVVALEGGEAEEVGGRGADAADDATDAGDVDPGGGTAGDDGEGGVGCERIECGNADVVGDVLAVEAEACGVRRSWS